MLEIKLQYVLPRTCWLSRYQILVLLFGNCFYKISYNTWHTMILFAILSRERCLLIASLFLLSLAIAAGNIRQYQSTSQCLPKLISLTVRAIVSSGNLVIEIYGKAKSNRADIWIIAREQKIVSQPEIVLYCINFCSKYGVPNRGEIAWKTWPSVKEETHGQDIVKDVTICERRAAFSKLMVKIS